MRKRTFCGTGCIGLLAIAWLSANLLLGQSGQVEVKQAVKVPLGTADQPVYLLDFKYAFPGKEKVKLENFGEVSGEGQLRYYTKDLNIQFRDSANGGIIQTMSVSPTGTLAGSGSIGQMPPGVTDFGAVWGEEEWHGKSTFGDAAGKVLNRISGPFFPSALEGVSYFITPY